MAKYRIGNRGNFEVKCDLLTESDGKYIVRFGNGLIKGVDKNRIHSLNSIDLDVLRMVNESKLGDLFNDATDKIGEFGRRVGSGIKKIAKDIWNYVVKGNNRVFFIEEDGQIEQSIHPINAMLAASEGMNIGYMPSNDTIEMANELNITPRSFEYEFAPYEYNGSAIYAGDVFDSVNESFINEKEQNFADGKYYGLDKKDVIVMDSDEFEDINEEDFIKELNERYNQRLSPKTRDYLNASLFILGAPGIGKTSILKEFKKNNKGAEVLTIMASNIEPEAFTMPARTTNVFKLFKNRFTKSGSTGEERIQTGDQYIPASKFSAALQKGITKDDSSYSDEEIEEINRLNQTAIEDLPKSWIPVYNSNVRNVRPELREKVLRDRINTANGGKLQSDGYHSPGKGGVLFIDEFTRLSDSGLTSIFDFPLSRTLGVNSDLVLGPKWFIVCAGNRISDMGALKKRATKFDPASKGRYVIYNFVPSYDEWKKWAEQKKRKGGGYSRVNKYIIEFIDKEKSSGFNAYYCLYKTDNAQTILTTKYPQASPRRWEQLSNEFFTKIEDIFGRELENEEGDVYIGITPEEERDSLIFDLLKADKERFKLICRSYLGVVMGDKFYDFINKYVYGFTERTFAQIINDPKSYNPSPEASKEIKTAFSDNNKANEYINGIKDTLREYIDGAMGGDYALNDDGVSSLVDFYGRVAGSGSAKDTVKTFLTHLMCACGYSGLSDLVDKRMKRTEDAIKRSFGSKGIQIIDELIKK